MITFIAVQLFWLSFLLIGKVCLFLLGNKYPKNVQIKTTLQFLRSTHPLTVFLIYWCIGLLTMSPFVTLSYIFELSVWVVVAAYGTVLLAALGVTLTSLRSQRNRIATPLNRVATKSKLFVVGFVTFCYSYAVYVKHPFDGDVAVQLGRITMFTGSKLSLASPFFANHGVVEPRYSTTLHVGLESVLTTLLRVSAMDIWQASYPFFFLLTWAGLFSLAWTFLGKSDVKRWTYVLIISTFLINSKFFDYAEMPDRIVLTWVCVLLIGLKLYITKKNFLLFFVGSLLIATTHAMYSLFTIVLLIGTGLLWFALRQLTRRDIVVFSGGVLLLALPVVMNVLYPNRVHEDFRAFNAGMLSGPPVAIRHVGDIAYVLPAKVNPLASIIVITCVAVLVWRLRRVKMNKTLKLTTLLLALACLLLSSIPSLIALLGYYYILRSQDSAKMRIPLVLLFLFSTMFLYNPILLTITEYRVPLWILGRSGEMNIFNFMAFTLGLLYAGEWLIKTIGLKKYTAQWIWFVPIAISLIISPYVHPLLTLPHVQAAQLRWFHQAELDHLNGIDILAPVLKGQVIHSNSKDFTTYSVSYIQTNLINIANANTSPMVNNVQRDRCGARLTAWLDEVDLRQAKVTRIVVDKEYPGGKEFLKRAESSPVTKPIARTHRYDVFQVVDSPLKTNNQFARGVCNIPRGQ